MKIRYYGHVGQVSGYGRAAADLCMSLLATDQVELEIRPLGKFTSDEAAAALDGERTCLFNHMRNDDELTPPDVVIVHTLPLDCARVHQIACDPDGEGGLVDERLAATPWVAYTTWEGISTIPEQMAIGLGVFDQVWTPSTASQHPMMRAMGTTDALDPTVKVIPHAFDVSTLEARRGRSRADRSASFTGEADAFRFYWLGAWSSRKNPAGILRAWGMAFRPHDKVELVLHSAHAQEPYTIALHQTGLLPADMAPVRLSSQPLPDAEIWNLHATSDCFVTSSRGEAWNLPAFDALLAGRHIIAPSPQGSDEFLNQTSAARYGGIEAPAGVDVRVTERVANGIKLQVIGAQGLTSQSRWLEPNLCELATLMQDAYSMGKRDLEIQYDPVERFSYDAVGKLALSAIEEL